MGGTLLLAEARGQGDGTLLGNLGCNHGCSLFRDRRGFEDECGLPAADQLEIDFREQFRVEQGTVLGTLAVVDAIAPAERVEAVGGARMRLG